MLKTTLRSLWSHKRRLIATSLAVLLGVAFMSGTLVLTSTINSVFDDLFSTGAKGTDALVRGPILFKSQQTGTVRDRIPDSTTGAVAAVPGVAAAEGSIFAYDITLLDPQGDPMGGQGPPTIVGSWTEDKQLNPYSVVQGRAPQAADEVVVDLAAAKDGPFTIGDDLTLVTADGNKKLKLVGITKFGSADSAAGSIRVSTTLAGAQALIGEPGKLDDVAARAEPGISPEQLVANIEQANVGTVDVVTGEQAAAEQANEIKSAFGFFSTILLAFAMVALFVGIFIISNTFSILVAQRTREFALLRAIGAGRFQVLWSVLLEAGIIGVTAALMGFFVGVGLAAGALALLRAIGLDLPSAGITVEPITAVIAITVGLLVTAGSAILPAIRATRVPPIAALRDIAIDRSGRSKVRPVFGVIFLLIGFLLVSPAFKPDPTTDTLPGTGLGLALIIVAVLVLGPIYARPLSGLVGLPLPKFRGVTGRLSRENAMRNPRRTASTASALIIGVTLIVFITVFAASVQTSISNTLGGGFKGDYIVQPASQANFVGVSPNLAVSLAAVPGVEVVAASSVTPAQMRLRDGGKPSSFVSGIEPTAYQRVFNVQMTEGTLADLTPGKIIVDRQVAKSRNLKVGDPVTVVSATGRTGDFEISALSDDRILLGDWTLLDTDANALSPKPTDAFMGIALKPGVTIDEIRPALKKVVRQYPTMKLQDQDQFIGTIVGQIRALLNVIYGLLAVSVLIALIGIANTLSLSIHERTRELGLLRAMGMSRSQLKSSVRWEAAIIALMGTAIGLLLGLGLSWILVKALASQGISAYEVPIIGGLSLVTIIIISATLGVLASLLPARRASKLNVLDAIATE